MKKKNGLFLVERKLWFKNHFRIIEGWELLSLIWWFSPTWIDEFSIKLEFSYVMMEKSELQVSVFESKICTNVVGMFMLKYSVPWPYWMDKDWSGGLKIRFLRAREEGWRESNGRSFELWQKLLRESRILMVSSY